MNWDIIFAIVFYLILYAFFLKYRKRFTTEMKFFVLYKTKIGLALMDKIAKKFRGFLEKLGVISIIISFIGMAVISYYIIKSTLSLIFVPEAVPQVAPVFPGIKVPGMPVLSFWHWIIAILVIAIVHEFSHGIYARLNDVKIKSSGFAFLGPILAAFVEPDEKQLEKKPKRAQLAVFSAGPFSNILFAVGILAIVLLIIQPISLSLSEPSGLQIHKIQKGSPAEESGLAAGQPIDKIDGINITGPEQFKRLMGEYKPQDRIKVISNNTEYLLTLGKNPENGSRPFIGVSLAPNEFKISDEIKSALWFKTYTWFVVLLLWLFVISAGVGLFNLLPIGPVDGGRMFYLAAFGITKNKPISARILTFTTIFFLLLIFINLLPYIMKFIIYITSLVALII